MEKLPKEIKLEIFVRLPAMSVAQCRCVCKSWRSLLHHHEDDHDFVDMHLLRSPENLNHSHTSFFALEDIKPFPRFHIAKYGHDPNPEVKRLNFPFLKNTAYNRDYSWHLKGSCNGLVCLARRPNSEFSRREVESRESFACGDDHPVYVCNPILREYVSLPELDLPRRPHPISRNVIMLKSHMPMGFGYHPITHEYKVVRIFHCNLKLYVDVYTLGKGDRIWRRKMDIGKREEEALKCIEEGDAVHINGSLHWITDALYYDKLVSFDLKDEKFQVTELPQLSSLYFGCRSYRYRVEIKNLGGRLNVIRTTYGGWLKSIVRVDIWVMKDYKQPLPWVELCHIEWTPSASWVKERHIEWTYDHHYTICYASWNHDHKVLTNHGSTCVSLRLICFNKVTAQMIPHIKSFVSLKTLGEPVDIAYADQPTDLLTICSPIATFLYRLIFTGLSIIASFFLGFGNTTYCLTFTVLCIATPELLRTIRKYGLRLVRSIKSQECVRNMN